MPTILLADDSITIQKIVNLTFSGEGIDVVTVGNGEAAVKKIHELRPALVLADIFMPGKNGYEVCDYIKTDPTLSATPVILLVGAFEPFDSSEAARVKADGHLTKPFEIKVLISAVNSLISAAGDQAAGDQREAAQPVAEFSVPEVSEAPVASEPAFRTFAPLPEMPLASPPVEIEVPVDELSEPERVDIPPMALGVDTEDVGLIAPTPPEPVAEVTSVTQTLLDAPPEGRTYEPLPPAPSLLIEESDPLGLLAAESLSAGREIALDARGMVVDIWEPRAAAEPPVVSEAPVIVPVDERAFEMVATEPPVEEIAVPEAMPEQAMAEEHVEVPVSQAVAAAEIETPTQVVAQPAASTVISEDLVERIANRVMEKLSREVIERIAWEVVPDLAELMIKEHVETHLKESQPR